MRSRIVWARNSVSSKMDAVGPEGHGGAGPRLAGAAVLGRRPGGGDLLLELAALLELGLPVLAVAVDLEDEAGRQGVDHRDAHAVQAARDLVALPAELAAGVQGGQDDLGRRLLGVLGVGADGDPRPVVDRPGTPPSASRVDVDPGGSGRPWPRRPSCRRPPRPGGAGRSGPVEPMYMPGPLADRLEPLEDGDVVLGVRRGRPHLVSRPPSLPRARPFRTMVFAVRIESPNGAPPAFRCERTILPDDVPIRRS